MMREHVGRLFQRDPAAHTTLALLTIDPGIDPLPLHRIAEVEGNVVQIGGHSASAGRARRESDETCAQPTFGRPGHGAE